MDNQQRFQNTSSEGQYQQSGQFDNSDPRRNQPGAGYGNINTEARQFGSSGDADSRKTDMYSSQESAPGSGFDNNATNLSDTSRGYRDPNTSGSFERSDYATGNTGIDDTQGGSAFTKPSAGDKIRGSAEKMAGKVTGNQGMQERGKDRKTGDLNDY